MPTYMYKCQNCGHRFEAVQTFDESPLEICPECQGEVRRVIGNVGVTFKGSGFYRTDSRSSGKSSSVPAEKSSKPAETKTEKKAEPKAESKPAPKKD